MSLVKYNNNSISAITSTGLTTGAMTLIKSQTASSSSTISFVHGSSDVVLDSTYPIYLLKFINIHPSTASRLQFNLSTDSGSNYNVTKTSTAIVSYNDEGSSSGAFSYTTSSDLAQSTGVQRLSGDTDADNDTAMSGEMWLFSLSSTTFVKHFMATTNQVSTAYSQEVFVSGYGNTSSAINAIQFSQSSGTIQSGTFKLYGIKDS